jgi:hypothetical protein
MLRLPRFVRSALVPTASCARHFAAAATARIDPLPVWDTAPEYTGIFINNEWHKSVSGRTFDTVNPTTGKVICKVQEGDKVRARMCGHLCACYRQTSRRLCKQRAQRSRRAVRGVVWTLVIVVIYSIVSPISSNATVVYWLVSKH